MSETWPKSGGVTSNARPRIIPDRPRLKVDEKSFQQGQNAFTGLTNSALKLGAVLASKLAIDKVVGDFKAAGTELNNFNRLTGLSTQNVQALGQALAAQGGNARTRWRPCRRSRT